MPASSPDSGASVTPPGTVTTGLSCSPARAIIIAGNPLSQDATPITPRAVGRDRACRRKTTAASLRYGSESIMPVVPCVRPSHGSEQNVANGRAFRLRSSSDAAETMVDSSKCPVCSPSATGSPSGSRIPPAVERMMYCGRVSSAGFHPMPAFCVMPKWSPLGLSVRNSAVKGNAPLGPGACVRISRVAGAPQSPSTSFGVKLGAPLRADDRLRLRVRSGMASSRD